MIGVVLARTLATVLVTTLFVVLGSSAPSAIASGESWSGDVFHEASVSVDSECEQGDDCGNPIVPERRDLSIQGVVLAGIFLAILVFGLRAIKRQRDEGRRSKFPPIG